jgi:hypothetical protein
MENVPGNALGIYVEILFSKFSFGGKHMAMHL